MKNFIILNIVFFSLVLCHKDKHPFVGAATALKNGKPWEAVITADKALTNPDGKIIVSFEVSNDESLLREAMAFYNLPLDTGTILLDSFAFKPEYSCCVTGGVYFTIGADGDVITDILSTQSPGDPFNKVHITAYDPDTQEMEGTFQLFLLADASFSLTKDTIWFRDGRFNVKVKL